MNYSAPTLRRKHICRRLVSAAISVLFLSLIYFAPISRANSSTVRDESFELNPGGQVRIVNLRGAIRIESWDDQVVRVIAEKKSPPGVGLDQGDLLMMSMHNKITIECKQVAQASRIDLTVYVPSRGQVTVTGGTFPVNITGPLASAVIESTSGNIGYRVPTSDSSRFVMNSLRGTVRSQIPLVDAQRIGLHSLQGRTGGGVAPIILNSQTGSITLDAAATSPRISMVNDVVPSSAGNVQPNSSTARSTDIAYNNSQAEEDPNSIAVPLSQRPAPDQYNPSPNSAMRSAQPSGNNTINLGGSDQSDDDNQTYRSGPFSRPRHERTTTGGNAGLSVRIIPSNPQLPTNTGVSPSDDQVDQASGPSSQRSSRGTGPASNNTISLGGSDQSDDDNATYKSGPLSHPRHEQRTSAGNAGLSVRIIPSNPSSRPVYREPAVQDRDGSEHDADGMAPNRRQSGSQSGGYTRRSNDPSIADATSNGAASRATAPPTLRRDSTPDQPTDSSAEAPSRKINDGSHNADEEAIVLTASLVNLNLSVTNRAGVALTNLKKEDFTVFENGDQQVVDTFAPTTTPFNLVLLIDLSGSITDKLDVIKSAALNFLKVIGPKDKVAIVTFTDQIRLVARLTSDRDFLRDRIKDIERPDGGTAFYEAVWYALHDTLRDTRGQRNAIVILSDGVDSSLDRYNPVESRITYPQLQRTLEEGEVTLFPIYLDTEYDEVFARGHSTSEAYEIARTQLQRLADVTGGQYFRAEKAKDISSVYKEVAAAIRTVYTIGYYSTNPRRDGRFRRVRVNVDRADAAVRTRKGYYAK